MKFVTVVLVVVSLSFAQKGSVATRPSGEDILKNMEANVVGIQDYTVLLDVAVDLERLKVPSMQVTMYFKKPDKVHFSSGSFALLPKESMSLSPWQLRSKFDITGVIDTVEGETKISRLELKPKNDDTGLRRVYASIDQEHWLMQRVSSLRADGRTITAEFQYQEMQGFWLPLRLTVQFPPTSSDTQSDLFEQLGPIRGAKLSPSGKISILYSDYRVNTGLKDDVFETPGTKGEP